MPTMIVVQLLAAAFPGRDAEHEASALCRKSLLGAEQNYYVQLYLEDKEQPGDLRISEVG